MAQEMHWLAHCVLAACHSLVYLDNKLVGDPVERASLEGAGWSYKGNDVVVSHNKLAMTLRIMARHHFSSALKRMSVLMRVEEGYEKGSTYALVKVRRAGLYWGCAVALTGRFGCFSGLDGRRSFLLSALRV